MSGPACPQPQWAPFMAGTGCWGQTHRRRIPDRASDYVPATVSSLGDKSIPSSGGHSNSSFLGFCLPFGICDNWTYHTAWTLCVGAPPTSLSPFNSLEPPPHRAWGSCPCPTMWTPISVRSPCDYNHLVTRLPCAWVSRDARYHSEVSHVKNIGLKGILTMKQIYMLWQQISPMSTTSNWNNENSLNLKISMIRGENNTIAGGRGDKTLCQSRFSVMTLWESNLTKHFQSHTNTHSLSPNNSLLGSEPRDIILCLRKKSNIYINFLRHYF